MLRITRPTSESEFLRMMEDVDAHLRSEGVPVHARPLGAWSAIATALSLELRLVSDDGRSMQGAPFHGDDLTIRIDRWFKSRYADRLKVDMGPGHSVYMFKGDAWRVTFPYIIGRAELFASRTVESSDQRVDRLQRRIPKYNMLDSVKGMPKGLKQVLGDAELYEFSMWYLETLRHLTLVAQVSQLPLIREVRTDASAAVQHLLGQDSHYGQSRWSSLQAAEKCIKAFLTFQGQPFPKVHALLELAELAESRGSNRLSRQWIANVQCSAGVRYGSPGVSVEEAIRSHHDSIRICGEIAEQMQPAKKGS